MLVLAYKPLQHAAESDSGCKIAAGKTRFFRSHHRCAPGGACLYYACPCSLQHPAPSPLPPHYPTVLNPLHQAIIQNQNQGCQNHPLRRVVHSCCQTRGVSAGLTQMLCASLKQKWRGISQYSYLLNKFPSHSVFNLLNMKHRPLYLKTQFIPRSKHFPPRL